MSRLLATLATSAAIAGLSGLAGCGGLPDLPPAPPSQHRVAAADTPLGRLATDAGVAEGQTGFRPLLLSSDALRARLALIARARDSLDLQTYLIGDDATGHQLLRALREAATRGVRVRLLVDDFYTAGMTDLLLGLAAYPNVELRLYNPFKLGRDSTLLRAFGLAADFSRLNRRMHNKLFIADGRVAVVGGRNLADAYFMRSDEGNFIDFDLLCVGPVAAELDEHFDDFWNSRFAVPVQALADNRLDAERRRVSFEVLTRPEASPARNHALAPPPVPDPRDALTGGEPLLPGEVQVYFDSPDKTAGRQSSELLPMAQLLAQARRSVVIVSPYFLPSNVGLQHMREARERGVEVQVVTNSLLDSDEPLVSLAYGRRRMTTLLSGARLFELSSARLHRQASLRDVLGASVGRLHAKLGFIDDDLMLVGSMNLDPRSVSTNTELVLAIRSQVLSRRVLNQLQPEEAGGVYEVRLAADGQSLEWVARDEQGDEHLPEEPAPSWWQRLRLWLLSWLVPDELL